jgi:hypothetical protein
MIMQSHINLFVVGLVLILSYSEANSNCCIAGTYNGKHVETFSMTCSDPEGGKFTMVMAQPRCGKELSGKITDTDGNVSKLRGSVEAVRGKCIINAEAVDMPKGQSWLSSSRASRSSFLGKAVTNFTGTLIRDQRSSKWRVTYGTYMNNKGCGGTFTMRQR